MVPRCSAVPRSRRRRRDRDGLCFFVDKDAHTGVAVGRQQVVVRQRQEARPVECVARVADELANKDFPVAVQRVGDEVENLPNICFEAMLFLALGGGHWGSRCCLSHRAEAAVAVGAGFEPTAGTVFRVEAASRTAIGGRRTLGTTPGASRGYCGRGAKALENPCSLRAFRNASSRALLEPPWREPFFGTSRSTGPVRTAGRTVCGSRARTPPPNLREDSVNHDEHIPFMREALAEGRKALRTAVPIPLWVACWCATGRSWLEGFPTAVPTPCRAHGAGTGLQ